MSNKLHVLSKLFCLSARRRLEWWPPFLLMRIKVIELTEDWNRVRIRLPLNRVSANAAGNMFGGFQASLADPVPALACLKKFPGYRVATKKLEIDFIRVGSSDLILKFDFDAEIEAAIAVELAEKGSATPCFQVNFIRDDGKICTRIKNTVAIRPKGYRSRHE
ncbi:MAG: DUF4442 domain-containing protein [Mariprofundus sp.]|nr:DUF4442 domain-containing protein [Mariprofundus sp.]